MTAPFSNDTHRFFIHTKISNEDEVLLSEYIKDFPHGYWGKNINIHKDAKTGSIKLQTGTIYMSYTNMNLPKNKSNTFELKVCYTKEDVY
ncbi:MAG: hypothetical protein ACMV1K_02495 [Sulfurospirillum sp.]